jgi:glutamyl-tRNA reductase
MNTARSASRKAEIVLTIAALERHLEDIRKGELARLRARLGTLTCEQELAIVGLTCRLVNTIAETAALTLRNAAEETYSGKVVELVRRLFNLNNLAAADGP